MCIKNFKLFFKGVSNRIYKCTPYFEIIDEGNCWDRTDELRKEMYILLLIIKNNGIGNKSIEDITEIITEYKRQKVKTNESENDGCKNYNEHSIKNVISNDSDSESDDGYQSNHIKVE